MRLNFMRTIHATANKLLQPTAENVVFLHVWSPGYKIFKEIPEKNGVNKKQKIFVPTTTIEVAFAYLKNQYGAKEYLKYKDDVHPGHVSVETGSHYLSLGMDGSLENLGLFTKHPSVNSEGFIDDCLGFKRVPDNILDFYTLNTSSINKRINELKGNGYSLLGNRVFKNSGQSCATAAAICLDAGGIGSLLTKKELFSIRNSIVIPSTLSEYAFNARKNEQNSHKEIIIPLSKEILTQKKQESEEILKAYQNDISETQPDNSDDSNNNTPKMR